MKTNNQVLIDTEKETGRLKVKAIILITAAVLAVIINIIVCLFYVKKWSWLFVSINAFIDIAVVWATYFIYRTDIYVKKQLLQLTSKSSMGNKVHGQITFISENTKRVFGLDCKEIRLSDENEEYILFLATEGNISLTVGNDYQLITFNNIVVEAVEK